MGALADRLGDGARAKACLPLVGGRRDPAAVPVSARNYHIRGKAKLSLWTTLRHLASETPAPASPGECERQLRPSEGESGVPIGIINRPEASAYARRAISSMHAATRSGRESIGKCAAASSRMVVALAAWA